MRVFILFACIFVFSLVGCQKGSENQTTNPATAPPSARTDNSNNALLLKRQQGRIDVVNKTKSQLSQGGIQADVKGDNKDVLVMKSTSVSNYEMLKTLKIGFESFREAGFSKIELTDSTGETQSVNLEVLDDK